MTKKNEAYSKLKEYVAATKTKLDTKLRTLTSDNRREYISNEMEEFMKYHTIEN